MKTTSSIQTVYNYEWTTMNSIEMNENIFISKQYEADRRGL